MSFYCRRSDVFCKVGIATNQNRKWVVKCRLSKIKTPSHGFSAHLAGNGANRSDPHVHRLSPIKFRYSSSIHRRNNCVDFVLVDNALLHHKDHVTGRANILDRIAFDRDHVGNLLLRERAEFVVNF